MHHLDIHVRDVARTKRLFDAIAPHIDFELRSNDDDFVSYWRNKRRPSVGFIQDGEGFGSGIARVAFGVRERGAVDAAADAARREGANNVDGPAIHPEYSDDYYAVFFEDADGNKYEIVHDPEFT